MSKIITPGNFLIGATISVEHSTVGITKRDLIKIQQSKLDYNNDKTYTIIPAGKTLSIDFELPEKAFVEKIRVFYAPEGFATFDGIQEVQPLQAYMTDDDDDTPIILRDPKDFDDTFRDPNLTTPMLTDGSDKNITTDNWLNNRTDLRFQTGSLWNSLMIDFGIVRPISKFILYSPNEIYTNHDWGFGFKANYVNSFGFWWDLVNSKGGRVYSSLDGVKFVDVTDLLIPDTSIRPNIPGFEASGSWIDGITDQVDNFRKTPGYFNNSNGQQPLLTRWLKFNQNGKRFNETWQTLDYKNSSPNGSYGVSEIDMYQYFSTTRLIEAIYFRDNELINIAQRYAGYQIPNPSGEPNLRYQDLYIHDITDKIRVNFTAHPSYDTWVGSIVAFGSYSSLNFGRGANNEINLLDAPVSQPGTAQPVVINNDSDVIMTDVEISPGFETTSDFQDVIEISEDGSNWNALFSKLGFGICDNDLGTECDVGNPDKQYVIKCQQGFQGECTAYVPLSVVTSEEALQSGNFYGDPATGSEVNSWDDNNSTYWTSANIGPLPANNAWLYNFGTLKFISHIKVRIRTNASDHTLEVSTDGSTWVLPENISSGIDKFVKIDGTYQYVRIYVPLAVVSEVAEVEIFTTVNLYRDKTWIVMDGIQNAGILSEMWYAIGYVPYNEDGDIEIYILRPNGPDYDLVYSSGTIVVDAVDIYRHLVDRQILVQPGDLIAIYADRCAPNLIVGGGTTYWGDGNITGTVLQSLYSSVGHKIGFSGKGGILLNIGSINPNTSKTIFVRSNIPSSLSQAFEREVDLVVATRTDIS